MSQHDGTTAARTAVRPGGGAGLPSDPAPPPTHDQPGRDAGRDDAWRGAAAGLGCGDGLVSPPPQPLRSTTTEGGAGASAAGAGRSPFRRPASPWWSLLELVPYLALLVAVLVWAGDPRGAPRLQAWLACASVYPSHPGWCVDVAKDLTP